MSGVSCVGDESVGKRVGEGTRGGIVGSARGLVRVWVRVWAWVNGKWTKSIGNRCRVVGIR